MVGDERAGWLWARIAAAFNAMEAELKNIGW